MMYLVTGDTRSPPRAIRGPRSLRSVRPPASLNGLPLLQRTEVQVPGGAECVVDAVDVARGHLHVVVPDPNVVVGPTRCLLVDARVRLSALTGVGHLRGGNELLVECWIIELRGVRVARGGDVHPVQ